LFFLFSFGLCFSDTTVADSKNKRSTMVTYAKSFIGVPYVYGGTDKTGIDCSGLIYTVARESIKLQLPRTVAALYGYVKVIPDNQKEAGDILFFKTVGDKVSHAGIYIGNNQFIHAASDGPNTGVILSSLSEAYWKQHYFAVGQVLPGTIFVTQEKIENQETLAGTNIASTDFFDNYKIDVSAYFTWNFFNANQFLLNPRGFSVYGNIAYNKNFLKPGLGLELRYDAKTNVFQIPVTFSFSISDYFRFYAGPVFTIGSAKLPGKDEKIKASVFPGVLGLSWSSKDYSLGKYGISFAQDISYSVFNAENGAALSLLDSIVSGLVFYSGVRVTFY